ncbi:AAA ATPase domain protein, partial [Vibrio parahaemolyticus EKP-008]
WQDNVDTISPLKGFRLSNLHNLAYVH